MRVRRICGLVIALCLGGMIVRADSLELKNGSLIKGRFVGATDTEIKFQVGSSMQSYKITDVPSVKFDSEGPASEVQEVREHARETAMFVIGAIAGGGKGAAIGAGVGAAAGAGSEIITKGDQVKVPSETLLDFTLQQSVSIPVQPN